MTLTYCKKTSKIIGEHSRVSTSDGQYGCYFKISKKKGIKVLSTEYKTLKAAVNGRAFKRATKELSFLKTLTKNGCTITPKGFSIKIVKCVGRDTCTMAYHVGIVMQHLGINTLMNYELGERNEDRIIESLKNQIKTYGFNHEDLHNRNVMRYYGKWYAIDFTPDFISPIKKSKTK